MPLGREDNRRALTVVDTSETVRTGHWYDATRPFGEIRAELLEAVGWFASNPQRRVATINPEGQLDVVPAVAQPQKVLFIMPREGTYRYREWNRALAYLEIAVGGSRALSEQHVADAQDHLRETEDAERQLQEERTKVLLDLEADRDNDLRETALAWEDELERLRASYRGLPAVARRWASAAMGRRGAGRWFAHQQLRAVVQEARVHRQRWRAKARERERDLQVVRQRHDGRRHEQEADLNSRARAARHRREVAAERLATARKQDRPRVYPGAFGMIRAFLDRELLDAARVAVNEMRKLPPRSTAVAEGLSLEHSLAED